MSRNHNIDALRIAAAIAVVVLRVAFSCMSNNVPAVMRVFSGRLWDHMWFVYDIIGIYPVMPVLHSFLSSGRNNALMLTGLLGFFTALCPAADAWLPIGSSFLFGGYLFYVCFGALAAQGWIGKRARGACCTAGLLGALQWSACSWGPICCTCCL